MARARDRAAARRRPTPHGFGDGRYKGVTVEASYDVGEYDVSILSAKESDGLVNWLTDNGYRIPHGAEAGARQLHQAEHALLRRQGEPRAHAADRQRLSAAAAGAL